ncbi:calcium-binding protein, partial [Yoonia sp. R2331]|uniref:calcium-binding protein n=1 Tax=Yoonia sp. R2331 TaxID=3237238 RepID=UPI0034E43EC5
MGYLVATIKGDEFDNTLNGFATNDELFGFEGNDTLDGGPGNDTMYGGDGNDIFIIRNDGAQNTILGEADTDELDFSIATAGWTIDADSGQSGGSSILFSGIEVITASDFDDVVVADAGLSRVYGGAGNDTLSNTAGAASIYGGAGDDTITGSGTSAQDLLFGGAENDTFVVDVAGGDYSNDFIFAGSGEDRLLIQGTADGQVFDLSGIEITSIEEVEFAAIGANRNITVILDPNEFTITGAEFANDLLIDGNNVVGSTDIVRVDLNQSFTETVLDFSGWQFTGWGAQNDYVEIIGSGRDETITGTSQSDSINGGAGNDTISDVGGGLDVTLLGGTGNDELDLSGSAFGWDIDFTAAGTNASSDTATGRVAEFETLTTSDFDDVVVADAGLSRVYGGAGNDTLSNTAGAASIYGGAGDDTITGSGTSAQDLLFGGAENDTFVVDVAGGDYSNDFIFAGSGEDRLLIQGTADGQVFDLSGIEITSIEEVEFAAIGANRNITVILDPNEFTITGAEFANDLLIDGNNVVGSTDIVRVDLNQSFTETVLDFSGWQFTGWGAQNDYVEIIGSGRDETITGTSQSDSINGGAGNDT